MKTFRHILLYLQAALMLGILSACHDDLNPTPGSEPKIETGIRLIIPNMNNAARFNSRAENPNQGIADLMEKEGSVNNGDIWLIIYNADGETGDDFNFHIKLSEVPELKTDYTDGAYKEEGNDGYTYTYVPMYPGNYKAYVVANLSEYVTPDINFATISEEDLQDLTLYFASHFNDSKGSLVPGHLPMVCLPENIVEATAGKFNILDRKIESLHCDLEFLCSKVRYTVLFDNTDEKTWGEVGFSQGDFGYTHFLDFDGASVKKVGKKTPIHKDTYTHEYLTDLTDGFPIDLTPVQYPDKDSHYFHSEECKPDNQDDIDDLDDFKTTTLDKFDSDYTDEDHQRAWQGVIYIPENKKTGEGERTVITLNGKVSGYGPTPVDNPYTFELIKGGVKGGTTSSTEPERGNFYDVTLRAVGLNKMDIDFRIMDWEVDQLLYELQGPVYLYVENTKLSVASGDEVRMRYESNVPISWNSPKWVKNGKVQTDDKGDIEFYDISVEGDEIVVRVTSRIPADELALIEDTPGEKDQYKYFHIVAGNLHKKIEVDPLSLAPFLMVDPDDITIDVRAEIASGNYDGMIGDGAWEIVVKTNVGKYTVTATNWEELTANGKNESELMILCDAQGNPVVFGEEREATNGQEILYLVYDKLNGGEDFWTKYSHTLGLTFSVDQQKYPTVEEDKVPIYTKPGNDNYVIHMKPWDGWNKPHVYIYQCLEFPSSFAIGNYKFANEPIGYWDNGFKAALEYSFTGKISFRGWSVKANHDLLPTESNWTTWNKNGKDGFYQMDALNLKSGTKGEHYNLSYDFFADYRKAQKPNGDYRCSACCREGSVETWPGIAMEDEGNGWWKIELSGVAVPGKTLLMFANTHTATDTDKRYPGDNEVGIPLFDYPDREGWIDLNQTTKAFTSVNPNKATDPEGDTSYVIYFQKPDGWGIPRAYCWSGAGGEGNQNAAWGDAPYMTVALADGAITWYKYVADRNWDKVIFYDSVQVGGFDFNPGHKYTQWGDQGEW